MLFILNPDINTDFNIYLYNLLKNNNPICHETLNKFDLLLDEVVLQVKFKKPTLKFKKQTKH